MRLNPAVSVLIVGGSGFVGGRLVAAFGQEAIGTYYNTPRPGLERLDITNQAETEAFVGDLQPSVIVHPAAQPNVDRCEREIDESYAVNVTGTRNMAAAAKAVGARYIYFSTDYLFDGQAGPYPVDATPNPIQVYGRHKLEAEQIIRDLLDDYVITRVCGVYGYHPEGKNFVMGLLDKGTRGVPMNVPVDQWGTPTYVESLAEAVRELALSDYVGTVHTVGPDFMVRTEFARLAAEVLGLGPGFLNPMTSEELAQPAARPLRGGVDNTETQALLKTRLVGAREGLEAFKKSMEDRAQ